MGECPRLLVRDDTVLSALLRRQKQGRKKKREGGRGERRAVVLDMHCHFLAIESLYFDFLFFFSFFRGDSLPLIIGPISLELYRNLRPVHGVLLNARRLH